MKLNAKKDRVILQDVKSLTESDSEKGFDVKNSERGTHKFGKIVSVPNALTSEFNEGETVILRGKAIPEEITLPNGETYYSYMSMDILCGYEQ